MPPIGVIVGNGDLDGIGVKNGVAVGSGVAVEPGVPTGVAVPGTGVAVGTGVPPMGVGLRLPMGGGVAVGAPPGVGVAPPPGGNGVAVEPGPIGVGVGPDGVGVAAGGPVTLFELWQATAIANRSAATASGQVDERLIGSFWHRTKRADGAPPGKEKDPPEGGSEGRRADSWRSGRPRFVRAASGPVRAASRRYWKYPSTSMMT